MFLGRHADGIREFSKALTMNPDSAFAQAGVAMCLAKGGVLQALDGLKAMRNRTYVSPSYVSLVYLALGDRDAEYAWLEKGYEDRAEFLLWLTVESDLRQRAKRPALPGDGAQGRRLMMEGGVIILNLFDSPPPGRGSGA